MDRTVPEKLYKMYDELGLPYCFTDLSICTQKFAHIKIGVFLGINWNIAAMRQMKAI